MKKDGTGRPPALEFAENPDILATVSRHATQRPRLVVGFAAETDDVIAHATAKRLRKGCDWIVANDVRPDTGIMGGTSNAVTLITAAGPKLAPHGQGRGGPQLGRCALRRRWHEGARRVSAKAFCQADPPDSWLGRASGGDGAANHGDHCDVRRTGPTGGAAARLCHAGAAGRRHPRQPAPEDRAQGITLAPMERRIVPTGLRMEIPPGFEVQIRPRSGLPAPRHHAAEHARHHRQRLSRAAGGVAGQPRGPTLHRRTTATGSRRWSWPRCCGPVHLVAA
jgi:hypothetical protein